MQYIIFNRKNWPGNFPAWGRSWPLATTYRPSCTWAGCGDPSSLQTWNFLIKTKRKIFQKKTEKLIFQKKTKRLIFQKKRQKDWFFKKKDKKIDKNKRLFIKIKYFNNCLFF